MKLHLDNVKRDHGEQFVADIQSKAMFLFYSNEKRLRHNVEQLAREQGQNNPVAKIKCQSTSNTYGKGVASHFDSKAPKAEMLCLGAKVALDNKNFCPQWGLHNGACGKVNEIVFPPGKNPNDGDPPSYVVVDFPLYCGPAWDRDNPKVSYRKAIDLGKKVDNYNSHLTWKCSSMCLSRWLSTSAQGNVGAAKERSYRLPWRTLELYTDFKVSLLVPLTRERWEICLKSLYATLTTA